MLPSDHDNKKSKDRISTFLGVDPGTLTLEEIERKAQEDKANADRRAPIVNEAIENQLNSLNESARRRQYVYNNAAWNRDYDIVRAISKATLQGAKQVASPFTPETKASNYSYSFGGGQFSGVASQARDIHEQYIAFDRNDPDAWLEFGKRRARAESEVHRGMRDYLLINGLDDAEHRRIIAKGEAILGGEYIEKWLDFGNIQTEEDLRNAEARYKTYKEYMDRYYIERSFFNSNSGQFETHYCILSTAPLPPWIKATSENVNEWEYYRGFQSETGNILHDQAMALYEEQEKYRKHGYKSAFNFSGDAQKAGVVDSFADVVYKSIGDANNGSGLVSSFWNNYKEYVRDYHINPLLSGKFGTVVGNHLWNLMDTMDFASRGVRALVAGDRNLGGTQHGFEGQEDFWALISPNMNDDQNHYYQELFIQNGGYDLLKRSHGDRTGFANQLSDEEIKAQLQKAFKGAKVSWEDVYNAINEQFYNEPTDELLSRTAENLKKAYSDPTAEFSADTGSVIGDMFLESVLDPGLLIGGTAKASAKSSAKEIADVALRGFTRGDTEYKGIIRELSNLSDEEFLDAMNSKSVRKAIDIFSGQNLGSEAYRKFLFKSGDDLAADAQNLSKVLEEAGILEPGQKEIFTKAVQNALTGTRFELDGKIIGSTAWNEIKTNRKIGKMAALTDKAIDTIDMAMIKGAFIEPFAVAKFWKTGKGFMREHIVRSLIEENARKASEAAKATVDAKRLDGAIGDLKTLNQKVEANSVRNKEIEEQVNVIKKQFSTAAVQLEDITDRLADMNPEDALREAEEVIRRLSGEGDETLSSLDTIIRSVRTKYSLGGDLEDVFDSVKRAHNTLTEAIERQDFKFRKDFLSEVRKAQSSDELAEIINRYSDRLRIHDMRMTIYDNLPNKGVIPLEDVDNILDDLSTGLLAERAATLGDVKAFDYIEHAETGSMNLLSDDSRLSSLGFSLERAPHFQKALAMKNPYPFLDKLKRLFEQSKNLGTEYQTISNDRILGAITEAHLGIADTLRHTSAREEIEELHKLSDELCNLKAWVEEQIQLYGVETVTKYHLDKQAKYDTYINDNRFVQVFKKLYNDMYKPAIDLLDSKIMQGTDAFGNSKVYQSLMDLRDLQYSYTRYRRFVRTIDQMDISDEAKYAIRNGLFGSYGESGKKLVDVTRQPGKVRRWLDSMMYNEFSASKVSIDSLTGRMKSLDDFQPDPLIADYVDEIKGNYTLNTWYRGLMDGDPADPEVYLQKQVLATILADPDAIRRFNNYDTAPIFVHVSTTGLSDNATISGISYFKWQKMDVPDGEKPTMQAIYDALHSEGAGETLKRVMSDDEIAKIDDDVLYSIYRNSVGIRSMLPDDLRALYKETFGGTELRSESDILEEFFSKIYPDTYKPLRGGKIETIPPTFVVHDLDGFNIPFINRRASELGDVKRTPRMFDYSNRLSGRAANTSLNTFDDLRKIANDGMLSDDEFKMVEQEIMKLAEDFSTNTGKDFNMLDIEHAPDKMRDIMNTLQSTPATPEDDDIIKTLRASINSEEASKILDGADDVVTEVAIMDDEARQIATVAGAPQYRLNGGVHYLDKNEAIEHWDEASTNALNRLAKNLGIEVQFRSDMPGGLLGFQRDPIVGVRESTIGFNTNAQYDLKETLIHELRHHFSAAGDFGAPFKQAVKERWHSIEFTDPELYEDIRRAIQDIRGIYLRQADDADYILEEFVTPAFQVYFADPDILQDIEKLMINAGYNAAETQRHMEVIEDLMTLMRGDFNITMLDDAEVGREEVDMAIRNALVGKLFTEGEIRAEFANSLINAVDDVELRNRLLLDPSDTNAVRAASRRTGERIVNVSDSYSIRLSRRYFDIGKIDDGIMMTYHDLSKMSSISKYVDDKLRHSIRSGSEEFLQRYKKHFDSLIEAVRNASLASRSKNGYFDYLGYLTVPQTATESYLVCQKLYDDLLKYWLHSDLNKAEEVSSAWLLGQFIDGINLSESHLVMSGFTGNDEAFKTIVNILEGEAHGVIFKDVPIESVSDLAVYTSSGKMKEGISMAQKLKHAYWSLTGLKQQEQYMDTILRAAGIETKRDFNLGMMFMHTEEFLNASGYDLQENILYAGLNRNVMKDISNFHVARMHNTRFNRLKVDGVLDEGKVLSELMWNNTNHLVFQKKYFSDAELKELKDFVAHVNSNGMDYVKLAEDRGAVAVYLSNNCEVVSSNMDGRTVRYIHKLSDNSYGARYLKPQHEHISLPSIDELREIDWDSRHTPITKEVNGMVHTFKASDFFNDDQVVRAYELLRRCWDDVAILSGGESNGTLGRVVFPDDADEYYKSAKVLMPDLLSTEGLRKAHMYGSTLYDPGFMLQGDYDILLDYFHTMEVQAENFKEAGALINNVFCEDSIFGNALSFESLSRGASDKELVDFFGDNSDFVLCSLVPADDTKMGVRVRQLKLSTAADVATARQLSNTVVLPYDNYLDMVDAINVKEYPSDLNRAINKLMLVYKAGALFHPGTWVRNFVDATQKAATDLGESPLNIFDTFAYELKCIRDINKFQKVLKYDDSFLTEANWDIVQQALGTDMTFENFELLRGMFDSDQYVSRAQAVLNKQKLLNGGRTTISGDRLGLDNLPEKDITKAYASANRHEKLIMDKKRFIDIYTGRATAVDKQEADLYEETMRNISNHLHNSKEMLSLSNAVSASFIPFNIGEITVRYAQMSRLNDLGFSNNQALKRVHLTQFKMAEHYGITNKLEYIVPFITFKYNNLKYWMRMMEENPAYFKYFEKLYGNVAEYTAEQYNEKGQQLDFDSSWMLKTGGIPIGNGKYYFKLNPSFFDAMQTMYGFPSDLIAMQNPLLRIATRASMYELGLNSKYFFNELDLNPKDVNQDLETIFETVAPRLARLRDLDKLSVSKFMSWANDLGPDMATLHKLIPSLVGQNYFDDYNSSTFADYQEALAKDGLWYDCNTGEIRPLSEKNEIGMNAPSQGQEGVNPEDNPISWMDINNYMMMHFNKIWDANVGKFVPFWEQTEGGLNQNFDFQNDPDAWDKLCREMLIRKGMKYDYNQKKFIPKTQWTPTGLNNPNLTFEERVKLMKEKFPNLTWDANQSTFVDSNHYIAGGLNSIDSFNDVQLYRYALFGQVYDRDAHKFNKLEDPKVVALRDLYRMDEYNNYYAMLGIPRLADVTSKLHLDSHGLLVNEEGQYVLMSDDRYNQRVFDQIRADYGSLFPKWGSNGRRYNNWKNYSYNKFRRNKPYKGRTMSQTYYTGFGWNDQQGYYRLAFEYSYQYHSPQPSSKLHRLISPPVIYPYGGGYNKFSFYRR